MSRTKLFIENFFIYGVGNVLTKVVPFLMLPVLTRLIADPTIFGVFDIFTIIIRFGVPLAVLGSYDAMFRLFFDDENSLSQKQVCSSSLAIVTTTSFAALSISIMLRFSDLSIGDKRYSWLIPLAGMVIAGQALRQIVAAPTKIRNRRGTAILLSLLGPLLYYAIAMVLAWKQLPLQGLIYGNLISCLVILAIYGYLNGSFFSLHTIRREKILELLKIGLPLAPTFLIYWIFTSCDRFMIGHMINMESVGLYGIGARLSAISQGIYMAFAGGWQFFAFSTMKDKDHTLLMSRVFEALGILSFVSLLLLLPWIDWIFKLMVAEPYRGASVVFPYLFISPLLLMLSQIAGTQLQVEKKTYLSTLSRLIGAVVNVTLNALFIPLWGISGAAVATFIGYLTMTVSISFVVIRMKRLVLTTKFLYTFTSGITFLLAYPYMGKTVTLLAIAFCGALFFLYRSEIFLLISKLLRRHSIK